MHSFAVDLEIQTFGREQIFCTYMHDDTAHI